MSQRLEIDVRQLAGVPYRFTVRALGEFDVDQLQRAMDICNKHCGDPTRSIGGPNLPKEEKRK